jgi:hypothetical protein
MGDRKEMRLTPDWNQQSKPGEQHDDRLRLKLKVPLDNPDPRDADKVGDPLHDIQLRRHGRAILDNLILAQPKKLIRRCGPIRQEKVPSQVQPCLRELAHALDQPPVDPGPQREVRLAGQVAGATG